MALPKAQDDRDEPSVGLVKLAREALERADGNWERALVVLRTIVVEDRQIYERLIDPLIDDGLWTAIRKAANQERQSITSAVRALNPPPAGRSDAILSRPAPNPDRGLAGLDAMAERTLYDLPMPGGKRLGEATPADILAAIDFYRAQVRGNAIQLRRYELIRDALGEGSSVERVVPLTYLQRLWMQAEEG